MHYTLSALRFFQGKGKDILLENVTHTLKGAAARLFQQVSRTTTYSPLLFCLCQIKK